jgi:hypothetical protein
VKLPLLTWATFEFLVVQAVAWNEMTVVIIWSMTWRIGGVKVIAPVNSRQTILPVAMLRLAAAADGEAVRAEGAQSDANITEDAIIGLLNRPARVIVNMGSRATGSLHAPLEPFDLWSRVSGPG